MNAREARHIIADVMPHGPRVPRVSTPKPNAPYQSAPRAALCFARPCRITSSTPGGSRRRWPRPLSEKRRGGAVLPGHTRNIRRLKAVSKPGGARVGSSLWRAPWWWGAKGRGDGGPVVWALSKVQPFSWSCVELLSGHCGYVSAWAAAWRVRCGLSKVQLGPKVSQSLSAPGRFIEGWFRLLVMVGLHDLRLFSPWLGRACPFFCSSLESSLFTSSENIMPPT
jgi:hypothetical protein